MKVILLGLSVLTTAATAPRPYYKIVGAQVPQVNKILGKPISVKSHGAFGIANQYRVPGFGGVWVSYEGKAPNLVPYTVRFQFKSKVDLKSALAATGLNPAGTSTHVSKVDGSLLVDNVRNVPTDWKVSYWVQNGKDGKAYLDFISPRFVTR